MITLDVRKTLEQNAAEYFERSKKGKKKLEGAKEALARSKAALAKLQQQEERTAAKPARPVRTRAWYEKFRWFISSEGFLCVGGRDATSNDILVKKHAGPDDLIFHAELEGSPFFIVQTEGKTPATATIEEAAIATASFSRGWRMGLSYLDVYHVLPSQVSKEARAGEYLGKGSFMIYGKKEMIAARIELAVGMHENKVMCAPLAAVRAHCPKAVQIVQGRGKLSEAAKKLQKRLGTESAIDEFVRVLPAGGVDLR